jgi:thiamine pyrophosphate-dependent acetolactate synthase large subunit-like protein
LVPESAAVDAGASVALPAPPPEAILAIAQELERAKRPLIIAGRGAVVSGAKNALIELGDELGALLATSAFANGLFAGERWNTGISGGFSSPAALNLIPQSDFILGFGVSFTHWTTRNGQLIGKDAKVLQVDIDPSRLGVNCRIDYGITSDVRSTAAALLAALRTRRGSGQKNARWRQPQVLDQIAAGSIHKAPYKDTSTKEHIDPRTLTKELDKILPLERVVVTDSGHFMGWPPLYFRVPDERGWCQPTSFQSVGLGMASAIGAALAQPRRLVALAIGDGGLLMSLGELETAVRLGVRMCIVVYNDLAYGAEVHYFGRRQYPVDIVRFPNVDFSAIARSVGASSVEVRTVADLAPIQKMGVRQNSGHFSDRCESYSIPRSGMAPGRIQNLCMSLRGSIVLFGTSLCRKSITLPAGLGQFWWKQRFIRPRAKSSSRASRSEQEISPPTSTCSRKPCTVGKRATRDKMLMRVRFVVPMRGSEHKCSRSRGHRQRAR